MQSHEKLVAVWLLSSTVGCFGALDAPSGAAVNGPAGSNPDGSSPDSTAPSGARPGSVQEALACDQDEPSKVGDTPLRRLTQTQYARTIRSLLGFDTSAATSFPEDGRVGAFPANPSVPVSSAHVQRFADAARAIAAEAVLPANLVKLLPCAAKTADDDCAQTLIHDIGARAFRHRLDDSQVAGLTQVYEAGKEGGRFVDGIELVLEAILQAPEFLYHVERKPAVENHMDPLVPLDDEELAARLSYFLWQTVPDTELSQAAVAGELRTEKGLLKQAERLLAAASAQDTIADFALNWLGLVQLDRQVRESTVFTGFGPTVGQAMQQETVDFVQGVFRKKGGSLTELMTASYSYTPDVLLPIYGLGPSIARSADGRVELPSELRAGVLTQAAFLSARSAPDYTSPVKRGVFILNEILCREMELPLGVMIPQLPPRDPKQSSRERFIAHEQPGCAACHTTIDHIGFAFERYDTVGAYREREGSVMIDDRGSLELGDKATDGEAVGGVAMVKRLMATEDLQACMVMQWHRFALGRMETKSDACALRALRDDFVASKLNLRELVIGVVTADSFRFRPVL